MEDNRGQYIVMWHMAQRFRKRGLLNRITGKKVSRLMPMIHKYDCEEIAKYGYNYIKHNGGIKPHLLKIIEA